MELEELIRIGECEYIDFKLCYTSENADFVHDILCLANAKTESRKNRYLVFGVSDTDLSVQGVNTDPSRKTSAQINDLLRNAGINHLPIFRLDTINSNGVEVDLLIIKDMPTKPYYVTRDYRHGSRTVRAGVVYDRNGDTNTPIDRCANERHLEWMFKQRLGLDLTPIDRAKQYLKDSTNWRYGINELGRLYFYYNQFPEFTITSVDSLRSDFNEPWSKHFPDKDAKMEELHLRIGSTILKSLYIIWCDGLRYAVSLPRLKNIGSCTHENGCPKSYYRIKDSIEQHFQEMLDMTYPQNSHHNLDGVITLFDTEEQATSELESNFGDTVSRYTYYKHIPDGYEVIGPLGNFRIITTLGRL